MSPKAIGNTAECIYYFRDQNLNSFKTSNNSTKDKSSKFAWAYSTMEAWMGALYLHFQIKYLLPIQTTKD